MKAKVTSKSLDYAAKIQYNKYIKLKHARGKYMKLDGDNSIPIEDWD